MEVGPVTGIRGVSLLRPPETEVLVLPAAAVKPSIQTGDDAYSAGSETPDRDIEEDISEVDLDSEAGPEIEMDPASSESDCRIDVLA